MSRLVRGSLVFVLGLFLASHAMAYTGSYTPGAGINGTVHDLGRAHNGMNYSAIPPDPQQRICIFCHAPHNVYKLSPSNGGPDAGTGEGPQAPDAFNYLPLWNHQLTANYAAYGMYQSGPGAPRSGARASQSGEDSTATGGVSLLCLSCHDGSVAVNSYGNSAQLPTSRSGGGPTIGAVYLIGRNNYLGNHHPVRIVYDAGHSAARQMRSADTARMGGAGPVRDHLYGPSNTVIECATCHSVHNRGNTGEALLWRSDVQSRLCLTCHDKGTDPGTTVP